MSNAVPQVNVPRSYFDLSHEVYTTMSFGEVIPNLFRMLIPKDQVKLRTRAFIKSRPLALPIMSQINLNLRTFVVPINRLWKYFPEFIAKNKEYYFDLAQRKPSALNILDQQGQLLTTLPSFSLKDFATSLEDMFSDAIAGNQLDRIAYKRIREIMSTNGYVSAYDFDQTRFPLALQDLAYDNRLVSIVPPSQNYPNDWYFSLHLELPTTYTGLNSSGFLEYYCNVKCAYTDQNTPPYSLTFNFTNDYTEPSDMSSLTYTTNLTQAEKFVAFVLSGSHYFGCGSVADNLNIHLVTVGRWWNSVTGTYTDMHVVDLQNETKVNLLPFIAVNRAYIEQYLPLPTQISPIQWLENYYTPIMWYGNSGDCFQNVNIGMSESAPSLYNVPCGKFLPLFHKRLPLLMNDYITTSWELPDHGASLEEAPIITRVTRNDGNVLSSSAAYGAFVNGNGTSSATSEDDGYQLVGTSSRFSGTGTVTVSMMSLKWANSAMRYIRRLGSDQTYSMYIKNHWGVSGTDDQNTDGVIYLGGASNMISVSPVIQNETTQYAPAASEAGRAQALTDSKYINYFSDDYAYLFQLMHLNAPNIYSEGIDREHTAISKEDFRNLLPEFQELGDTPIMSTEIYGNASNTKIYGYHNRLQYMRSSLNRASGNFRNVMGAYLCRPNVDRNFSFGSPSLDLTYLTANKGRYNNIFADVSETYQDWLLDIHHELYIKRPISKLNSVGI